MTEKLAPPLDRGEGWAFVVPDVAIVIASYCHAASSIVPVCPFKVAWEFEKYTVPKSASGSARAKNHADISNKHALVN